jgi:hypothetical protein
LAELARLQDAAEAHCDCQGREFLGDAFAELGGFV